MYCLFPKIGCGNCGAAAQLSCAARAARFKCIFIVLKLVADTAALQRSYHAQHALRVLSVLIIFLKWVAETAALRRNYHAQRALRVYNLFLFVLESIAETEALRRSYHAQRAF